MQRALLVVVKLNLLQKILDQAKCYKSFTGLYLPVIKTDLFQKSFVATNVAKFNNITGMVWLG